MVRNFMAAPPVFSGENFEIWSVKMKSYLEASGLWNVVMSEIPPLQEDPTVAQIRNYNDEAMRRSKAKICIHCVNKNSISEQHSEYRSWPSIFSLLHHCNF